MSEQQYVIDAPQTVRTFKDTRDLSLSMYVFIALLLLIGIIDTTVSITFIPSFFNILDTIKQEDFSTVEAIAESFSRWEVVGNWTNISSVIFALFCAISMMIWIYRSHSNHKVFSPQYSVSPGWAVISFFIPVVNFVVPALLMQKLWQQTHKLLGSSKTAAFIWLWWITRWAAWVTEKTASIIEAPLARQMDMLESVAPDMLQAQLLHIFQGYLTVMYWAITSGLLGIISFSVLIYIVYTITSAQTRLAAKLPETQVNNSETPSQAGLPFKQNW